MTYQLMCVDSEKKVGVYFGTTGGEVWAGSSNGVSWRCIAQHLPEIYAVTVAG
ncbi:MAG: hypothetical protein QM808_09080 [Steroidobacteraceae bacterium]